MIEQITFGAGLAFAAAVQPGPLQAYLFSRTTAVGWRRALPACFSPLLSDGPIAVLALLLLGRLSPQLQSWLRTAGGLLLFWLAWKALLQWRRPAEVMVERDGRAPRSLIEAALVNIVNPNPYIGWTLILGPAVLAAWREAPHLGVAVVASFYLTMVTMLAALIFVFGGTKFLGTRFQRALLLLSAVILAGLGVYQLFLGMSGLAGRAG